jgi:hypothetical protein
MAWHQETCRREEEVFLGQGPDCNATDVLGEYSRGLVDYGVLLRPHASWVRGVMVWDRAPDPDIVTHFGRYRVDWVRWL